MAEANVGFATLSVIPSMRGVQAALSGQVLGPSAAAGKQAGGAMGAAMGGALKVGLGAAVAGIGAVAGLAKLGGSFDDAFDTIRVGTGATGDALDELKGSFKTVFSTVPTDMGAASTAVADLNTRLGLTGEPLEALSTQLLELSRITGTDLGQNIEAVTRTFGDWGVAVGDQGPALDAMFRASQATGIEVGVLGEQMVKYGAPLRQLGFDFETTAGLLGKFEKEGVNAELVMGSMRIALGRMARDGEPAEETLQRVTEQIAGAGSASEANALALEVFGARAGPDMAAAIREGRFDLGELYDTISAGNETILGAAEDTADFGEKWQVIKNRVLTGLEPLATRVFDAMGAGLDLLSGWWDRNGAAVTTGFVTIKDVVAGFVTSGLEALSGWWADNGDNITTFLGGVASFAWDGLSTFASFIEETLLPTLGDWVTWIVNNDPVLFGFATLIGTVLVGAMVAYTVAAGQAAVATVIATWPFLLAGAAIVALAAGLYWAWENSELFRDIVVGAGIAVLVLAGGMADLAGWVKDLFGWVLDKIPGVVLVVATIVDLLSQLRKLIPNLPGPLDDALRGALGLLDFDTGGVVPGRVGEPRLALVHGGETILPTHRQDVDAGSRGGGGMVNEFYIYNPAPEPASESILTAGRRVGALMGA